MNQNTKTFFATVGRSQWSTWPNRLNSVGFIGNLCTVWGKSPWLICVNLIFIYMIIVAFGAIILRARRDHLAWARYKKLLREADEQLDKLKAASIHQIRFESELEQAEAIIAKRDNAAAEFSARWGLDK